ncbi:MAG TPA: hypothetical protein VJ898_13645 [Natrialbaceae archaeon]|nr:hypothetical protein [Natrialbaceae archaeon]
MAETRSLRPLRWGMVLVALGLVAGTGWKIAVDSPTESVAVIGQWLALAGAVTTLVLTVLLIGADGEPRPDGPAPESSVGVLGSTTGMLAVVSASPPGRPVLVAVVVAGAVGLLGGTVLFVATWRGD